MKTMTSRERTWATLRGEDVDQVPVMYWINQHAGLKTFNVYQKPAELGQRLKGNMLWNFFQKENSSRRMDSLSRALPIALSGDYIGSSYVKQLGSDLIMDGAGSMAIYPGKMTVKFENKELIVFMGDGTRMEMGSGIYLDVTGYPVNSLDDVKHYRLKKTDNRKVIAGIKGKRKKNPDSFIYGTVMGVQDPVSTKIMPMDKYMMFLIDHPKEMKAMIESYARFAADIAQDIIKAGADAVLIFDDYGFNNSTFLSLPMWEEFSYPYLKIITEAIHEAGGAAILHSCGYQMTLLPYYVEAGLDALQAFQEGAGNSFDEGYKLYGDELTFITGIDIQQGESWAPEELKKDILRNYKIGGRNGHHILGTTHHLQYTMSNENISTIFDTVKEIQQGRYD